MLRGDESDRDRQLRRGAGAGKRAGVCERARRCARRGGRSMVGTWKRRRGVCATHFSIAFSPRRKSDIASPLLTPPTIRQKRFSAHIIRGTGLTGLAGIYPIVESPSGGAIVRPLLADSPRRTARLSPRARPGMAGGCHECGSDSASRANSRSNYCRFSNAIFRPEWLATSRAISPVLRERKSRSGRLWLKIGLRDMHKAIERRALIRIHAIDRRARTPCASRTFARGAERARIGYRISSDRSGAYRTADSPSL